MKPLIAVLLLLACTPAYSGFFDQLVDEAKKTLQDGLEDTINGTSDGNAQPADVAKPEHSPSQTPPKATDAYDKGQVREIQQQLNALGYPAGTPDGLFGKGTHRAIEAFQKDHGMVVDGKPSSSLLAQLKATAKDQTALATASIPSESSGALKPKTARELSRAAYLATLHYYPEVLEEESWLKQAAAKIFPDEYSNFAKNEFTWQKNKAELKTRIENKIANPPLTLTASWSNQAGGDVRIGQYDFNQHAFEIRLVKISPIGLGDPRPYVEKLQRAIASQKGLPVAMDVAERLAQHNARRLYAEYDYTITGAKKYSHKGETKLISTFNIKKIDLYSYIDQHYNYVATITLPDLSSSEMENP